MIPLIAAPLVGAILDIGKTLIERMLPEDPIKRAQAELELYKLSQGERMQEAERQMQLSIEQIRVNAVEASSENIFKSGWRPAVGWTCVGGLVYQLIARPVFVWLSENNDWSIPPSLELETLLTLLFGMLGLGAFRTAEKIQTIKLEK